MRRRQLLASLTATAAAAVLPAAGNGQAGEASSGQLLIARVRDAMLGLDPVSHPVPHKRLSADLGAALADFRACRYRRLAFALLRLIASGHAAAAAAPDDVGTAAVLAGVYTLTTRMLIKLDDQQLGWMAADRARVLATAADDPLVPAEAARNLAVLARKAGWHAQAMSIALSAAGQPGLRDGDPDRAAERGLLIQSAAYTAARNGDRSGMRELTSEAAAIAAALGGATLLRDHGGGFSAATVALHRISAECSTGEPGAAIAARPPDPSREPAHSGTAGPLLHRRRPRLRAMGPARGLPQRSAGRRMPSPRRNPCPPRRPRPDLRTPGVRPDRTRTARPRRTMRHHLK